MSTPVITGQPLICCPICDVLHEPADLPPGGRTRCVRCRTVLESSRPDAPLLVTVLSLTVLILMSVVIFFPFLELRQGVFTARASVFDTVMSFSGGVMAPLSIAVALFVIVLPVLREVFLVWALGPVALLGRPVAGARTVLRWATRMRPWAMAEIFMVGVAVALVKLADLATLTMGPAFWSFAAIVAITAYKDSKLGGHTIWAALEAAEGETTTSRRARADGVS